MFKLKVGKKVVASLLAVGLIAGVGVTNAKAANTSDTGWNFTTFGDTGTNYTDPRQKQDSTPAYSNVQTYNGKSGDYLQMYLVDSNRGDFRTRIVKTVSGPGQYSVSSYAYEDRGQVDVRMAFYAPWRLTYSWSASGLWSPDSTRTYN
jgi:hypothetical protein